MEKKSSSLVFPVLSSSVMLLQDIGEIQLKNAYFQNALHKDKRCSRSMFLLLISLLILRQRNVLQRDIPCTNSIRCLMQTEVMIYIMTVFYWKIALFCRAESSLPLVINDLCYVVSQHSTQWFCTHHSDVAQSFRGHVFLSHNWTSASKDPH